MFKNNMFITFCFFIISVCIIMLFGMYYVEDVSRDARVDFYNHSVDVNRYNDGIYDVGATPDRIYQIEIDELLLKERAMGNNVTIQDFIIGNV